MNSTNVKGKQSERVFAGKDSIMNTGFGLRANAFGYHDWFFGTYLNHMEYRLLFVLQSFVTHGIANKEPWITKVPLYQVAKVMGVNRSVLSEPLRTLRGERTKCPACGTKLNNKQDNCPKCGLVITTNPVICPICGKEITLGIITGTRRECNRLTLNLQPYVTIADHLQGHYETNQIEFDKKQALWLQTQKSEARVNQMIKARNVRNKKPIEEGKIVAFSRKSG